MANKLSARQFGPATDRAGWRPLVAAVMLLSLAIALPARSQVAIVNSFELETSEQRRKKKEPQSPFMLPKPSPDAEEAMGDFRRAVNNQLWEKAFKQLDKLVAAPNAGLIAVDDGFKLPMRTAAGQALARLPAPGKSAYRVFYDAKAKALWDEVQKEEGKTELEKLSRLASLDLITSVGDLAANRLGDLLFEQGDLDGAIESWQSILEDRPDSGLSRLELLVKTATALARAGRLQECAEIRAQVDQRHAGESVVVAGKKVVATEYLATLGAHPLPTDAAPPATGELADLALPDNDTPLWQFQFLRTPVQLQRWNPWMGQENYAGYPDVVMPTAISGDYLYGDWQGCHFALELASGKLAWLSQPIQQTAAGLQQSMRSSSEEFELGVAGDQLWATAKPAGQPNQPGMMQGQPGANAISLVHREAKSGKELLASQNDPELKQWLFLGTPLGADGLIYITACKPQKPTELFLLALRATDGHLAWSTALGTYQFNPRQGNENYYSMPVRATKPTLARFGASLVVDTQAGGLVELQTATGQIRWAYTYESQAPSMRQQRGATEPVFNPSVPVLKGGTLYLKGMHSPRLCAIRPDGKGVRWKRSVPENATLAGIDETQVYLSGEEILAYELKTQKLVWSSRLPTTTAWMQPLLTRTCYYQFTPRGVYELEKSTGRVRRVFRGADLESAGGVVLTIPKLLITVSNRAVSAYPLTHPAEVKVSAARSTTGG